ncbi:MAG: hypothetical protein JWQ23_1972 [Herminiimonas sp.]|nr:hypothetical protein [Herminiimonas sp.]
MSILSQSTAAGTGPESPARTYENASPPSTQRTWPTAGVRGLRRYPTAGRFRAEWSQACRSGHCTGSSVVSAERQGLRRNVPEWEVCQDLGVSCSSSGTEAASSSFFIDHLLDCKPIRDKIYEKATEYLRNKYGVSTLSVGPFSAATFKAIQADWSPQGRRYEHWDWKELHQGVVNKPCRFEAVISNGEFPLGVVIGKPDKTGTYLGIPFLEAFPAEHPLTGETAANLVAIASTYAGELGLKEVRLLNPIDELLTFYQDLEFKIVRTIDNELYLVQETGA